jgi:hypothetical protein
MALSTTGCGWALQAWIEEMSLFVKTLDPLHMLTVVRGYGLPGLGFMA